MMNLIFVYPATCSLFRLIAFWYWREGDCREGAGKSASSIGGLSRVKNEEIGLAGLNLEHMYLLS